MINVSDQQNLLLNVAKKLNKKIVVYAVGGTAMMFHGLKDTTKDIDLVFNNEKDREEFKVAAKSLGYNEIDSVIVYGAEKENRPVMLTRGKGQAERFDLFNYNVISFFFSDNMKVRSENTFEFEHNLVLKIANIHDLILMKCATDRQKDAEDVQTIINKTNNIDWNLIIEESKHQVSLGKKRAIWDLGDFLERLKDELKLDIPQEVINTLFNLVQEQAEKKKG